MKKKQEQQFPDTLAIEVPKDGFTDEAMENLRKIIASKGTLIQKALGVEALPVEVEADRLRFAWLAADTPPEEIAACTQFIAALCDMAKRQKRVIATEKAVENEKFTFRIFLIRLGFIGDEYVANVNMLSNLRQTSESSHNCNNI